MKPITIIAVLCFLLLPAVAIGADIHTLLDAAAKQPAVKASELAVQEARLQVAEAKAALYPKLNLFGRAESYNSPTNLRPMTPTEVNIPAGDAIPFSRNIFRYGAAADMPLFVKQLYTLSAKMKLLQEKADYEKTITLVTRLAGVVSLNAGFEFLTHLSEAIAARKKSLQSTIATLEIKVKNGRTPESELLKVEALLNDLGRSQNDIRIQILDIQRDLKKLTGIKVTAFAPMQLNQPIQAGPFVEEKRLAAELAAAQKDLQQNKERRYPTLSLAGALTENEGKAYNTDTHISRSYNSVALVLKLPLFDKTIDTAAGRADIRLKKTARKLDQLRIDLAALADNLRQRLPVISQSRKLAEKSVRENRQLLVVAKIAYQNGRMTTEEYLRNESKVLDAQAGVYQSGQKRWQVLSQQAVLYGQDLRGVVQ